MLIHDSVDMAFIVCQDSIFKCEYDIYGHLSPECWIRHVWEFAQKIQ